METALNKFYKANLLFPKAGEFAENGSVEMLSEAPKSTDEFRVSASYASGCTSYHGAMIPSSDKITDVKMASHFINILTIATVTAIATISLTHRLLSRPWCIQIHPNGSQHILYGNQRCEAVRIRSLTAPMPSFQQRLAVHR